MFHPARFIFNNFGLNQMFVFPSFDVDVARTCSYVFFRSVYCKSAKRF